MQIPAPVYRLLLCSLMLWTGFAAAQPAKPLTNFWQELTLDCLSRT